MFIKDVFIKETVNNFRLSGILERSDGETIELFFKYSIAFKVFLNVSADPSSLVLLIPAVEKGEKPEIVPEISKNLPEHSAYVQEIFTNWYPDAFRKLKLCIINSTSEKKLSTVPQSFFPKPRLFLHTIQKQ